MKAAVFRAFGQPFTGTVYGGGELLQPLVEFGSDCAGKDLVADSSEVHPDVGRG